MRCALDSPTRRPVPAALLGLALLLAGCASTNPPPPATWLATLPAGWAGAPPATGAAADRQALLASRVRHLRHVSH